MNQRTPRASGRQDPMAYTLSNEESEYFAARREFLMPLPPDICCHAVYAGSGRNILMPVEMVNILHSAGCYCVFFK